MEPNYLQTIESCPHCNAESDSLKQYRYLNWLVFFLVGYVKQYIVIRGCPSCLRRIVWQRCLVNLLPANLLWPILVLPWALVLTVRSYQQGASGKVVEGVSAVEQIREIDEDANPNLSRVTLAGWIFGLSSIAVCVAWALLPKWLGPLFGPQVKVEEFYKIAMLVYMGLYWAVCKYFGIRFLKRSG